MLFNAKKNLLLSVIIALIFAGAALAVLTALPTAAAPVYSVSVYTGNQAADGLHFNYNSSGDYATQVSGQAAWYDASTGTATQLGTLGGSSSGGRGISDNGKVAGWSYLPGNSAYHAFLWEGGALQDLGTLGGANSHGYAVNDSGQVVGYSYITGNSVWHAFLWEDGTITDLGTLGGDLSYAYDINNAGQVVGQSLIAGDSA